MGLCSLWWCWQVNEVVNVRVLPAFGLVRSERFSWQECGGETHCWREKDLGLLGECRETPALRPGAAGAHVSALLRADGRVKQD